MNLQMFTSTKLLFLILLSSWNIFDVYSAGDDSYEKVKALEDSLLSSGNYSTTLRPVLNQTKPIVVNVKFSPVAVVSVDNVKQELIINAFLALSWTDEIHHWDPSDLVGVDMLMPDPKQIWRPRLLIINTLGDRDPFSDDYSHTFMGNDGSMRWVPGGLFHTYCALDMQKFPFDVQNCHIQMCPISHTNKTVQFQPDEKANLAFYYSNPGWDLLNTTITTENISVVPGEAFTCPTFAFKLKRRPFTIVLNVIFPVMFISILNNFVFLIPTDSGEKISYAITVLLSLSVFLSMVSTMTPQLSDAVPALTIYLFILLLSSVLSVIAVIFTGFLHGQYEKEEAALQIKHKYKNAINKVINMKRAVTPLNGVRDLSSHQPACSGDSETDGISNLRHNKYELICRHIDKAFFVLMKLLWIIITIWYFTFTNS